MRTPIVTTNYFRQGAAASAVMLAALATLAGCDDGPECLDYDTQTVQTTTIVNGKVVPGFSTVTVCTRYAEPSPSE
ncbi:hypothetical protein HOS57_gp50 [Streptomyces phage AbbeyMikolon]|uniref:Lipoprotein n=1 Tax=Streptomyces phage AbbeyMikolon TaxID=2059880 RepID=A0A2H5BLG1_9CAUD|nr:hypothetical protein HOS57_gp50 [Streptomyces phage AbbeyMikolon]AUG87121.1 hypothetical protein SEA_ABBEYMIKOLON_50 [Streptomyces phage AbbeyMikolon]